MSFVRDTQQANEKQTRIRDQRRVRTRERTNVLRNDPNGKPTKTMLANCVAGAHALDKFRVGSRTRELVDELVARSLAWTWQSRAHADAANQSLALLVRLSD